MKSRHLCRWLTLAPLLVGGGLAPSAVAQTADSLFTQGTVAYQNLDFDAAAQLLRRGFASGAGEQLPPAVYGLYMTYLATAEMYRGDLDSTAAVFDRLATRQPNYIIDELVFPPNVADLFTDALVRLAMAGPPSTSVAPDPLGEGVTAYDNLDFDSAADLLRNGLLANAAAELSPADRGRYMTYLAATEFYRGNQDSATAVFQRLAASQPDYIIDELVFPPDVTALFRGALTQLAAASTPTTPAEPVVEPASEAPTPAPPVSQPNAGLLNDLLVQGLAAYTNLDFDAAVDLLDRGLETDTLQAIPRGERARILMHIGAAETFRGDRGAAIVAFRRIAILDPNYPVDDINFSPDVSAAYGAVRLQTIAVQDLVGRGVAAYGNLDFDAAAWQLRRALASGGAQQLDTSRHASTLTYLAASEYYRGDQDAANEAFKTLVLLDPGYVIDDLTFPPDVSALFINIRNELLPVQDQYNAGLRAYASADFAAASSSLRSAFQSGSTMLSAHNFADLLAYFGASELFLGNTNTASAAFRTIVVRNPQYRLDDLVFPPQVATAFAEARAQMSVVGIHMPQTTTLRYGADEIPFLLRATAPHDITVEITHPDGRPVRTLYSGAISDTMELRWNGRDSGGGLAWDGRDSSGVVVAPAGYVLAVTSLGADGQPSRRTQVGLEMDVHVQDTLAHPAPPEQSLFRIDRRGRGPGIEAIVGAVIGGAAIALLPSLVAPNTNLTQPRFAVAGAVGVAGIFGLIKNGPGGLIPANVLFNNAITQQWQRRMDAAVRTNAVRLAEPHLVVHSGTPVTTEMRR